MRLAYAALFCVAIAIAEDGWAVDRAADVRYAPWARMAGIQGHVKLKCNITATGEVRSCTALSGPPLLSSPTIAQIKAWRFRKNPESKETNSEMILEFEYVLTPDCESKETFVFEAPNRARIVARGPCLMID
jgi:hypothetical protein